MDETYNQGFPVEMYCCALKQLSISLPCLGDVKLPLTPLISDMFMAQPANLLSFFNSR